MQPSQLAKVAYKVDAKTIIARFTKLSFLLKPLDTLDREVRTRSQEVKDVVA